MKEKLSEWASFGLKKRAFKLSSYFKRPNLNERITIARRIYEWLFINETEFLPDNENILTKTEALEAASKDIPYDCKDYAEWLFDAANKLYHWWIGKD